MCHPQRAEAFTGIMRPMQQFEQLGLFYLGKRYDLATRARVDEPVLYDAKDLVTHAVCVGMTGSGKTGLGITEGSNARLEVMAMGRPSRS